MESVPGKEQTHAPVHANGYPGRKQLSRKVLVDTQVESKSVICCCVKEG